MEKKQRKNSNKKSFFSYICMIFLFNRNEIIKNRKNTTHIDAGVDGRFMG
jgi:hypothetical protein